MDTLIVTLPAELKDFMNKQIAEGNYTNASECFQTLLEVEKFRQEHMAKFLAKKNDKSH